MGALTGNTISSSYLGLLKTSDNAILNTSLRLIEDGGGTDASIKLSTTQLGLSDGTTTVPSLTFSSNSDTGFYYASDVTYYTLNGVTQLAIGSASLTLNNDSKLQFGTSDVFIKGTTATDNIQIGLQGATKLTLHQTNGLTLAQYGSGSITGTVTQRLGVTSSGQVVEIPIGGGAVDGSGTTGTITKWTDSDTIGDSLFTESSDGINLADNKKLFLGTGNDLEIYHNGTHSYIDDAGTGKLILRGNTDVEIHKYTGEYMITATADGAVSLYYNDSLKLSTAAGGVNIAGNLNMNSADGYEIRLGSDNDLKIYHDGSSSFINESGTGDLRILTSRLVLNNPADNENMLRAIENGAVELFYNNVKKLETTSSGIEVTEDGIFGGSSFDNPNSYGRKIEIVDNDAVGLILNDTRDTNPMSIDNSGAVMNLRYNTTSILSLDGATSNATFAGAVSTGGYLTLNSSDNIPRLIFNGSGDDFFLSNTATFFGLYNDTDGRWDIKVFGDGSTTFAGDVSIEDNLYLTDAGTTRGKIQLNASDRDDVDIKAVSLGSNMKFFTVDTERMRLDSSGDLLLGNTVVNPASGFSNQKGLGYDTSAGLLEVASTTGTALELGRNQATDGNVIAIRKEGSIVGVIGTQNWGIGTTSPDASLEVSKGSEGDYLIIGGDNASNSRALKFTSSTATSNGALHTIDSQSSNGVIALATGGAERMRLDSSGNLALGNTSAFGTTSNRTCLSVNGTTDVSLNVGTGGTQRAFLYSNGSYARLATVGTIPLQLGSNDTADVVILDNGNVGIGITTPSQKLNINGVGGSPATSGTTQNGIVRIQNTSNNNTLDIGQVAGSPYGTWLQATDRSNLANTYPLMLQPTGGFVGIGETSPDLQLHIKNTATGSTGIAIENTNNAQNLDIDFYSNAGSAQGRIRYEEGAGALNFLPNVSSSSAMYINYSNNIGIGTTSPDVKLTTVVSGSNSAIKLDNLDTNYSLIQFNAQGTTKGFSGFNSSFMFFGGESGTDTKLQAGGQIAMTIKNDTQNVGIGTDSPAYKVEINDDTANGRAIQAIQSATSGTNWGFQGGAYGSGATKNIGLQVTAEGATTNYSALFTGGNVGIGTTSPATELHVKGSGEIFRIEDSSATGSPFMSFFQNGTRRSLIQHLDSGNLLSLVSEFGGIRFMTATDGSEVERMRIDSSGRVLIGQNSNTGSANANNIVAGSGSGNEGITIFSGTDSGGTLAFMDAGANEDGFISYNHPNQFMQFGTQASEKMRITSGGELLVAGTLNTYTSANRGNITLNGTAGNILAFTNNTSAKGYIYHDNTDLDIVNEVSANIKLKTNGTERMRIRSTGVVEVNSQGGSNAIERMQVFTMNCTSAASGTSKEYVVIGDTNAIDYSIIARQDATNVGTCQGRVSIANGTSSGFFNRNAFSGNVTAITTSFGSTNDTLDITVTYTGTAPTIHIAVNGISNSTFAKSGACST